jgi:hypothetical protein
MALPGASYGFWLLAEDIEPRDDPAWAGATDGLRAWFWREAVRLASAAYDRSRERGLDRFDRPLAAITDKTRKYRRSAMGTADPDAPPLTPAWGLSRTRSLVRYRIVAGQGAWFWHIHGPQKGPAWGQILAWHAAGAVNGGKVRDVLGFSPRNLAEVRDKMRGWWIARRGHAAQSVGVIPTKAPQPIEITIQLPKPVLPRSQRKEIFGDWWKGQTEERVVAQKHVETMSGEQRGPGTVGVIFRAPPTRPRTLRLPPLIGAGR